MKVQEGSEDCIRVVCQELLVGATPELDSVLELGCVCAEFADAETREKVDSCTSILSSCRQLHLVSSVMKPFAEEELSGMTPLWTCGAFSPSCGRGGQRCRRLKRSGR